MRQIHLWCQSFEACPGGIQTFTRFVIRALQELYPDAKVVVFAKNDLASEARPVVGGRDSDVGANGRVEGKDLGGEVADKSAFGRRRSEVGKSVEESRYDRIRGFGQWPSAMRAAVFALSALRHARRDQPELIISTHVNFAPVGRLARKWTSARFAAVGHGIEVWNIPKAGVRNALRTADQLIAVSDFTRIRMAEEIDVAKERIELLPNTFDENRFVPAPKSEKLFQRYQITKEQPVILTVARMEATEQYKGYENVLLALPEILARFPNARYLIVGDGRDRKRVVGLSRKLRVEGNVVFAGYVPNEELAEHYNICDVFAMPSKGEGFGIVFLEALGCGKPVIAGNKDGSAEPLLHGKLGRLVDPDSVEQIADAICSTLSEVGRRRSAVGGGKAESEGRGTEVGGRQSEAGRRAESEGQRAKGEERIAEVGNRETEVGEAKAQRLRAEVIAAFGFERFRQRLGEIVEKMLLSGRG